MTRANGWATRPDMDDGAPITPQAIVTVTYSLAALLAIAGGFAWLRLLNRRSGQANAGMVPDLNGLSDAATATGISMMLAGGAFLFSTWL